MTSRRGRRPCRPAPRRSPRGPRPAPSSRAPGPRRCSARRRPRPPPWRGLAPRSCGAGRGACIRGGTSRRFALHQRRDGIDGAEVLLVELLVLDDDAEGVLQENDELDGDVLLQPTAYGGPRISVA